ncbi:2-oxoglutarate-dependent dioxygenase 19 [Linum perenne]
MQAHVLYNITTKPLNFLHNNKMVQTLDHEEIPTIDYFSLFSPNPIIRSNALACLSTACEDYGFFNLVNHGIPERVMEGSLSGIGEFFERTDVKEKSKYRKGDPKARILWDDRCHAGENREHLKLFARPQLHCPPNPPSFRDDFGDYVTRFHQVELGLARSMSTILGQDESYIETTLNLESGFDVATLNRYPPNFKSKGTMGLAEHTDPGFIISLIQDIDGGLQILTHQGKWVNVHIPPNAILIQLGDQLEVLTNGKYKSHVHRVLVGDYKVRRISISIFHGPSIETYVTPGTEFVDEVRRLGYRGMTYSESLEANDRYEIEVQSCIKQLRLV